jgi:hypothetical protein
MLRNEDVFCAKANRQRQQHDDGLHDVGHFGNATGRSVLRLSSSILGCLDTL